MSKKEISDLIDRYEQAIESGKNIYFDADEFSDLAEYYDSLDEIDTAREIVDTGLAIHPGSSTLLLKKAKFAAYDGEYSLALKILEKSSLEYDFDLFLVKIECYLQLELYNNAADLVNELLNKEEDESPESIYSEIGFLYVEADCFKEAIDYFQQSIKYDPENIDVLSDLAYAYEMIGDFDAAVTSTNKILDIEPYTYEAWVNLGKLFSLKEEFEKAIDAFDFALTINDSDDNVTKLKAHCMSLSGRLEEAIEIFNELLLSEPNDVSIYFLLSECYQTLEMYDEALQCLSEYEDAFKETAELLSKRVYIFLQKGDYNIAYKMVQEGLTKYPDFPDLNVVAGEVAFKQQRYEEAKIHYLSVYTQDNNNFHLMDRLAIINIKEENYGEAAYYTEKLLELDPSNQAIKERLALLYFEMDDKDQFNDILDQFTDSELLSLFKLIYTPQNTELFDRNTLITYLNKARETRTLFKNIQY